MGMKFLVRDRVPRTLDQQVESVWQDDYLRNVASRILMTAENTWRSSSGVADTALPDALEIGGAGGITKRLRPEYVVTDIRKSIGVDQIVDATHLPFKDKSFDIVFAIDVIHHVTDLHEMFAEVNRVLRPGGVFFMREPYWGPAAQLVWRTVHPEDFSIARLFKVDLRDDPMSGNQALAYALVKRPSIVPPDLIPKEMQLRTIGPLTGIAFFLSGGVNFTTKVSRQMLTKIENWELKHPAWLKVFGFSLGIYLVKNSNPK
jgi:SAM-dependent methyltransferase